MQMRRGLESILKIKRKNYISVYQTDVSEKLGNNYYKYQNSGYIQELRGSSNRNGLRGSSYEAAG